MKLRVVVAITAIASSTLAACVARVVSAVSKPSAQKRHTLTARVLPTERRIEVAGVFNGAAAERDRDELTLQLGDRFDTLTIEVVQPVHDAHDRELAVDVDRNNGAVTELLREPVADLVDLVSRQRLLASDVVGVLLRRALARDVAFDCNLGGTQPLQDSINRVISC